MPLDTKPGPDENHRVRSDQVARTETQPLAFPNLDVQLVGTATVFF